MACKSGPHPGGLWRTDAVLRHHARHRRPDIGRLAGPRPAQRTPDRVRDVIGRALLLFVLTLGATAPAVAAGRTARLVLIATGGTIANDPHGRLSADELVEQLPGRASLGQITTESFANASSTALSLDDWSRLSRHVTSILTATDAPDGVVVTSGTDTLEELAWFLHLTVPGPRPVVVVGAMRRPGTLGEDGPRNLADALRVAAAAVSRDRGTLVVMHGQVHSAWSVRKHHTTSLSAFDEAGGVSAGAVTAGRVTYRPSAVVRPAPGLLQIATDVTLPRVDILETYQGADGDLIEAAAGAGAAGIVIAGAGAGSLTPSQATAARRIARAGIPVVVASRTGDGLVGPVGGEDVGLVSAGALSPLRARLLLVLALARQTPIEEIGRLFASVSAANSGLRPIAGGRSR